MRPGRLFQKGSPGVVKCGWPLTGAPSEAPPPRRSLRRAPRWEGVLKAGECLFVPAGCPHAVANLTKTSAISANVLLPDNLELARQELRVAACACLQGSAPAPLAGAGGPARGAGG